MLGLLHGLQAEEQLVEYVALLLAQSGGSYQQGLALHHRLHLFQVVGDQCGAAAHDVEYGVGEVYARRYLHRARYHVDVGVHALFLEVSLQDVGVGGGDSLALKPLRAVILLPLGDGQRQAAAAEAEPAYYVGLLAALQQLVLAHDAEVGNALGYRLRDVIVAEV